MIKIAFRLTLLVATLGGCATSFTGSAHVEGGRSGCEQKCAGEGLAMEGLVYMGEYSSACVCAVPGAAGQSGGSASGAGGAVGVVMQMRRQQEQSRRHAP